jgi:hypothetical protein
MDLENKCGAGCRRFCNIMVKQYYLHVIEINICVNIIWICKVFLTSIGLGFPKVQFEESEWFEPIFMWSRIVLGRSQWSFRLRCSSAATRLLGSRVRIPLRAWIFICCVCCVLCRYHTLRRAVDSFRGALRGVVSMYLFRNLKSEAACTRFGLLRHRKKGSCCNYKMLICS